MARSLLVHREMNLAISSSLLVLTLCAPALANPAKVAAPPAPPAAPARHVQQPLQLQLTVAAGAQTRVHDVAVFDSGCNRVDDKGVGYEDEINVCTRPAPHGVFVEVAWRTRNGASEYRTSSGAVVTRKGGRLEVGRSGGTRFTLQLL